MQPKVYISLLYKIVAVDIMKININWCVYLLVIQNIKINKI
jgi:hypothetical protein